ncbi:MAG: hypothetical protein ACLPLZ_17105 [Terracidiphilus sp.]
MRPQNIGRALGIGVRIAGRIAGRQIMGTAQSPASAPQVNAQTVTAASQRVAQVQSQARVAASVAAQTSRGVSKGIGGFLRPFRRVGGIVWLEVTGSFFLLFAALFALRLWQSWSGISQISRDLSIGAAVVFLYLGVTSFWRARHR